MRFSEGLDRALDLLWPRTCTFCRRPLRGGGVCPACREALDLFSPEAKPSAVEFADGCVCAAAYSPLAARAVHRFKFYGRWHYAKVFAALLAPGAAAHLPDGVDAVTFVPGRAGSRYNPAELLARELCRALALPAPVPLLRRTRRSPRQSTLPQERRKANALGLFALRPGAEVSGLRVLLVDDVCTTGATLSECARMLRAGGASFVLCAAFARSDLRGGDARPTA